jgi:hypothetical protein
MIHPHTKQTNDFPARFVTARAELQPTTMRTRCNNSLNTQSVTFAADLHRMMLILIVSPKSRGRRKHGRKHANITRLRWRSTVRLYKWYISLCYSCLGTTANILFKITRRTSHLTSEVKAKVRPLVESIYGFESSARESVKSRNRQLTQQLKHKFGLCYRVSRVYVGCFAVYLRLHGRALETKSIRSLGAASFRPS